MNSRQADMAAQEATASAAQLLQAQIAVAAAALGNLGELAAAPAESADGVVVAALDAASRGRDGQPEVTVVSDSAPAPQAAPAAVVLAQAAQSEAERKAAVVVPASGAGDKKDDDKGAAVAKDDDDKGGMWGWIGGLGLLAAAAGGGGGGSSAAPAPPPSPEVLSGTSSGTVKESGVDANGDADAGTATASGNVDTNAGGGDVWVARTASATYGSFTVDATGAWVYTLDNTNATVDALNVGSTALTDSFVLTTAGGATKTVSITINGTNDAAEITGTSTGTVLESITSNIGIATATGNLASTDVDNTADSWTAVTDADGTYGKLSMNAAGEWTYTLDNTDPNTQALRYGDVKTETFTVTTVDGTEREITITVNGATDYNLQLVGAVGGNGTALQENQSTDIFKANGSSSVPIGSGAFADDMIIDIANDTGFALTELTYYAFNSTVGGVPGNGTFTLVAGVYNSTTGELDYTPTTWASDDIMVMWDGSASTNSNYGYILENVAVNDTFTVEGLTFKYEGSGSISVITA